MKTNQQTENLLNNIAVNDNTIDIVQAAQENLEFAKLRKKEELQNQLHLELKNKFKKIIIDNHIYYVALQDNYVQYDEPNRKWLHFKNNTGLFNFYKINGKDQIVAFKEALEETGNLKKEAVNTFRPVTDHQLNFCSRDNWLKPQPGEVHDAFRLGFKALCGEKQDAQDSLEHTIAWKYLHPEDYKLPMFAIHGEGGVLKNEILLGTLGVVFGKEQVLSTSCSAILEGFNGELLGKTIVMFDESKIDKTNYEKLKALVHNEQMHVNVKFGLAGSFDNTPLYFSGSNEITGAVRISGSSVDRRFSIVSVKRNIMEICADEWGTSYNKKSGDGATVNKWFTEFEPALRDPEQVAIWLNSIIEKWKDAGRPKAYHGEDYDKLSQIQKSSFEHTMEWIFNRDNEVGENLFTYICDQDAYTVYKVVTKENSPAVGTRIVNKEVFIEQMDQWLDKNYPEITRQPKIKWRRVDGKSTSKTVYKSNSKTCVSENQDEYIIQDSKGIWKLVDPILIEVQPKRNRTLKDLLTDTVEL
ncbi:MAG: primase-helicase family protein [Methylobacter sp.]